jgi:hypothetical protein
MTLNCLKKSFSGNYIVLFSRYSRLNSRGEKIRTIKILTLIIAKIVPEYLFKNRYKFNKTILEKASRNFYIFFVMQGSYTKFFDFGEKIHTELCKSSTV